MCGSMVDIQSAAAEIRRVKKKEERMIENTGQKYNGLPYYIGWAIINSEYVLYCVLHRDLKTGHYTRAHAFVKC